MSRKSSKLSAMQAQMRRRLQGGHFRLLNETLYTQPGKQSFQMFQKDPSLFDIYHKGFAEQVGKWPTNPLDVIIKLIQNNHKKADVIADFGCGEARLAASVQQKCHSFDLVAANDRITACDIAHTPLSPASVDVAVFCLALMGTDADGFLKEAARVLKPGGKLYVAEVRSRIEGGEEGAAASFDPLDAAAGAGAGQAKEAQPAPQTGKKRRRRPQSAPESAMSADALQAVQRFVTGVEGHGFRLLRRHLSNKMFILLEFTRNGAKDPAKQKKKKKKKKATGGKLNGGNTAAEGKAQESKAKQKAAAPAAPAIDPQLRAELEAMAAEARAAAPEVPELPVEAENAGTAAPAPAKKAKGKAKGKKKGKDRQRKGQGAGTGGVSLKPCIYKRR